MREDFDTNPKRPKKTGIVFALIFVIIIAFVGLYVLGASSKKEVAIISPTPTPATLIPVATEEPSKAEEASPTKMSKPTSSPTPSKKPTFERSGIEITVLNGSGVAGAAKNISSFLSGLGYTIKTVGNAKNFDYQGITINISKEKSSYLAMLKKDLAEKSSSISAQVDENLTVDTEVIVGK